MAAFPVDDHPVELPQPVRARRDVDGQGAAGVRRRRRLPPLGVPATCWPPVGRRSPPRSRCSPRPDALPAVFHCAAGKDRTGLLAHARARRARRAARLHHRRLRAHRGRMIHARAWYDRALPRADRPCAADVPVGVPRRTPRGDGPGDRRSVRRARLGPRATSRSLGVSPAALRPLGERLPGGAGAARFTPRERHGGVAGWWAVHGQRRARSAAARRGGRRPRRRPADGRRLRAPRAARRRGDDTGPSGSTSRSRR